MSICDNIISLHKMIESGFKPGELQFCMSKRRSGKSTIAFDMESWDYEDYKDFKKIDEAVIDGVTWVSVRMTYMQFSWVRKQDRTLWVEHTKTITDYIVDLHEKLYTIGLIKWS